MKRVVWKVKQSPGYHEAPSLAPLHPHFQENCPGKRPSRFYLLICKWLNLHQAFVHHLPVYVHWDLTQGALPLSCIPRPFYFALVLDLNLRSPCLSFPNHWDYKYIPLHPAHSPCMPPTLTSDQYWGLNPEPHTCQASGLPWIYIPSSFYFETGC